MKAEDILEKYAAGEREFSGSTLSDTKLTGAVLTGVNFSQAKFTRVNFSLAKLTNANLSRAVCDRVNFSGADLTLADLSGVILSDANLSSADLTRAELNGAQLRSANLGSADLKDATLRHAVLSQANLSRSVLRHAKLTCADLTGANLSSSDLTGADLSGADLRAAELRQVNLSRANLQGANLSGANLRWADLSGADLRWADLSSAKFSGANLTGADLSHATLLEATLVHVDLTRANLAGVDWMGADLSGSTLTGVKLHGVSPFGVKTEGAVCRWIDLSQNGDQSKVYQFQTENPQEYFNEKPPTVQVIIDDRLGADANCALAVTYQQVVRYCGQFVPAPSVEVYRRRTVLTFELESDVQLFLAAYVAIFPFEDAKATAHTVLKVIQSIPSQVFRSDLRRLQQFQQLVTNLSQHVQQVNAIKQLQSIPIAIRSVPFFQSPTRTVLMNSNNQMLTVYENPHFGRRRIQRSASEQDLAFLHEPSPFQLPTQEDAIAFVTGFHAGSIAEQ
ncbi:pentapeptide repeat-containing protein [Myxacorys almedinensis]|uniref:Pentapeptide repeat-containing protein n=1 Tax=Myxacorys almedinensis A TaxID=2690445 RepID=A0A8J7Z5V4_9CYAN|nr:pentapeptide repeat-containing protein [Myxacorys almedinensis]NDJ18653.1 hypothetical protein [Myxacorys almedinensis A]